MDDDLTGQQKEAASLIMRLFIDLPWTEREAVARTLEANDVFCWHCGYGSVEAPNPRCQCWNDE